MKYATTAFLLTVLLLAGCGQKGPLYLPPPDEPAQQQPASSSSAQPEQDEATAAAAN